MAVFVGLGVALLLIMFQPFGTYSFQHEFKYLILAGYGVVIFLIAIIVYEAVILIIPKYVQEDGWTIGKEFLLTLVFFFLSVFSSYIYHHLVVGSSLSFSGFMGFFIFAVSVGIIPLGFIFFWSYSQAKAKIIEKKAIETFKAETGITAPEPVIHLEGSNKNEFVKFLKSELLLISSSDNYIELILAKGGSIEKHLLRATLSSTSEQLAEHQDLVRIHRSFLINTTKLLTLGGKAPAYYVTFDEYPALGEIPVSRQQIDVVRQCIADKLL
ncbi:MAG: LytTR family transcriptional regulator [Saprospiraceae bacterium]|nr:LytTR family transcriptional regulator [Saprospiraceae bacterium]